MGSSKSNSIGRVPQWRGASGKLSDYARGIPLEERPRRPALKASGGGDALGAGGPRAARELASSILAAHRKDSRYLPLLQDCSVGAGLEELYALSQAVTIEYRTPHSLFAHYEVNPLSGSPGLGLTTAVRRRFSERLLRRCTGEGITDVAERSRVALINTVTELLTGGGGPDELLQLTPERIHEGLRAPGLIDIAGRYYANYLAVTLKYLISSTHSDISPARERAVNDDLRRYYCDRVGRSIADRARRRGWRPGDIPLKVSEWIDIVEEVDYEGAEAGGTDVREKATR